MTCQVDKSCDEPPYLDWHDLYELHLRNQSHKWEYTGSSDILVGLSAVTGAPDSYLLFLGNYYELTDMI